MGNAAASAASPTGAADAARAADAAYEAEHALAVKLSLAEKRKVARLDEDALRAAFRGLQPVQRGPSTPGGKGVPGVLDRTQFDEALAVFPALGLPPVRGTPLGRRLFDLWDLMSDGIVAEDEFVGGVVVLASGSQQQKADMTFSCYDLNGDGRVSRAEFVQFISLSWLAAFRRLGESPPPPGFDPAAGSAHGVGAPSHEDAWALRARGFAEAAAAEVRHAADDDFDALDTSMTNALTREQFAPWAASDRTAVARADGVDPAVVFLGFGPYRVGGAGGFEVL
jgi:hypothetical protein